MTISKLNTINEVEMYRKSINEACDNRVAEINRYCTAIKISDSSFGCIKENMENMSHLLFESDKGIELLKRYSSAIKSSKELSTLHSIYESIRKSGKDTDVNFVVNEIASGNWNLDKQSLKNGMSEVGNIVAEAYLMLGDSADGVLVEDNVALGESVEFIATSPKKAGNISEYGSAVSIIKEAIEGNANGVNPFKELEKNNKTEKLINKFNEQYAGKLGEAETELIKELASGKEHKEIFEEYKKKCLGLIEEASKNEDKSIEGYAERVKTVSQKVSLKEYKEDTFADDVCTMIDLCKIL